MQESITEGKQKGRKVRKNRKERDRLTKRDLLPE
jgi:hypothetical protein